MITITHTIKSYAKINLSLNIVSKKKINNLHQIESLVALIDLADEIKISEIRSKKHKVIFRGKYSKGIPKFIAILKGIENKGENTKLFMHTVAKISMVKSRKEVTARIIISWASLPSHA